MTLITTDSHQFTTLKTSKMQSGIVSNRVILGICAFSVSFGLSLVPRWDFTQALITGIITVLATYSAALFVDKRRRNYELMVLNSLHRKIRELEGLKYRIAREVEQVEQHKVILYTESQQLQNQIAESRNKRDSLHREIGNFAGQKKKLELEIDSITNALDNLENSTIELKKSCAELAAEKRRLELNCNLSRSEINQLQAQIEAFKQKKEEIENNLILSNRLKPQLEERLYELRIEIQDLESKVLSNNNLLKETTNAKENLENRLTDLQTQKQAQQQEISELQNQISLLQEERDLLQNQVWELLQNIETLNPETIPENIQEDEYVFFPFDDLLEPVENKDQISLPTEWKNFLEQLPTYQIQVLKAIIEQDNPQKIIKKIAESQITMPNLLIDAINEVANNTIGELIIETREDKPQIYSEHLSYIKKIMATYKDAEQITQETNFNG